tara:strand:+ start:809 stop:1246 length:438 start_codon:yes stop_codon:yes gene_type:complete
MFCKECGKKLKKNAAACTGCGVNPRFGKKFCGECGVKTKANQIICVKCGVSLNGGPGGSYTPGGKSKLTAFLLAFILGGLGIHKFYLGSGKQNTAYTTAGIIQLVLSVVTCGFVAIIPFIEAIIYIVKSDEEFQQTYVDNEKAWF